MTEAFPPEQFLAEVQRRHDQLCTNGNFGREEGLIKLIKRTSGALAGEFGRLEAIHKEKGADHIYIPHGEKAKLYELAVDLAAQSMLLCEGSVQARRSAQLMLEGVWDTEDVETITQKLGEITDSVLEERKKKDAEERLMEAQQAKEELEKDIAQAEEKVKATKSRKKRNVSVESFEGPGE